MSNPPFGPVVGGPLLGEQGEHDAFIWAHTPSEQPLTLTVFRSNGTVVFSDTQIPKIERHRCVVFRVTGLDMFGTYEYKLSSSHGETERFTIRRPPPPHGERVRIVFGSCIQRPEEASAMFEKLASEGADLLMLVGDNVYFKPRDDGSHDADSEASMMSAHFRWRRARGMRALCANRSTLAIWDDHDFGMNDSGWNNPVKSTALRCFKLMWAQRHYGLPDTPGIFSSVRCGPAQIILLDVRYDRRSEVVDSTSGNGRLISKDQMHWLQAQLQHTDAPVKLIVSGSQMLPTAPLEPNRKWECWKRDAPEQLKEILAFIAEQSINGVILVSGDVHLGHLMFSRGHLRTDGRRGGDVWELTSSALTDVDPLTTPAVMHGDDQFYDPYMIREVLQPNYGVIDIDLGHKGHEITLELKTVDWPAVSVEVDLETLRTRPPRAPKVRAFAHGTNHSKALFFRGKQFVEYDIEARKVVSRPQSIDSRWPGLNEEFDAGIQWPIGRTYFFRNNGFKVWGVSPVADGKSSYISDLWPWPLIFQTGIDAALLWEDGIAYFFKGKNYIRFNVAANRVDGNYPQPIAKWWKGVWEEGIDAAFIGPNRKVYFFRGDEYIRYDIHNNSADGPPKPIASRWPGLDF